MGIWLNIHLGLTFLPHPDFLTLGRPSSGLSDWILVQIALFSPYSSDSFPPIWVKFCSIWTIWTQITSHSHNWVCLDLCRLAVYVHVWLVLCLALESLLFFFFFVYPAFQCAQGIHCPTLGSLLNRGGVYHVLAIWRDFEHKLLLGSIPILSSYLFIICLYVIEIILFLVPFIYIYIYGSAVYIYIYICMYYFFKKLFYWTHPFVVWTLCFLNYL